MLSSRYYSASRLGTDAKPRTAMVVDEDDELYTGFNEVAPALDTRNLREDHDFQETLRTTAIGRKLPSRMGTGMMRMGTVSVRANSSRAGTAARPVTAVRAAGYTSTARELPTRDDVKEDSIEERVKQMEARIMTLVEESCMLSARSDPDDDTAPKKELDLGQALAKAQEASAMERQLIRMQEQANLGDTHNLDLTFAVLCNLAGQYALNEMYTEALNTYQLLTRNKLFPHANRLKENDAYECVVRDVVRGDRLSRWSRRGAAHAERCLALAAAAAAMQRPGSRGPDSGMGAAQRAVQRLKAVARAHPHDRVLRAEANTDAAFVAYALGNWSEARQLSEAASRDDPYSCAARVTAALAAARADGAATAAPAWRTAADLLTAATHLDPADLIAAHDLDCTYIYYLFTIYPDICRYSLIGNFDTGVTCALAQLHSEMGDTQTAKHHYQDVEAVWPCEVSALEWLGSEAPPDAALQYYRRAARLQPNNVGLKLIVKLCGDQGLAETSSWTRELQRAQARVKQKEQDRTDEVNNGDVSIFDLILLPVSVTSAGSISSGASQSPIDQIRGGSRVGSAAGGGPAASRRASDSRPDSALNRTYTYSATSNQDGLQPVSRSINRSEAKKKHIDEFDDDLPLPPE
ncbi:hypothetical protein HF086_017564 [Spodoptera exigua]|uniref:Uncharacterized protein n=1 Tax=Spodoptera exigua TaxID=7107 RepID=A0A922N388_SPOEX|nr:hypothetical protein HF086_017564 [Spodoptera exigua]